MTRERFSVACVRYLSEALLPGFSRPCSECEECMFAPVLDPCRIPTIVLMIALHKCVPPFVCASPSSQRRLSLMVVPLNSPQVPYDPPTEYPDNEQDKPIYGVSLVYPKSLDLNRDAPSNISVLPVFVRPWMF